NSASPMLPVNPSTPRSNGSSTPLAASATNPTSLPPSTSTAAAWTSCPRPTKNPECPNVVLNAERQLSAQDDNRRAQVYRVMLNLDASEAAQIGARI